MNYEEANTARCKRGEMKEMRTRQREGELNGGADNGRKLSEVLEKQKPRHGLVTTRIATRSDKYSNNPIHNPIHTAGFRSAHRLSHGGGHVQELHVGRKP